MKKLAAFLLTLVMVLSLAACGTEEPTTSTETSTETSTSSETTETTEASGSEATVEKKKITVWAWDPNFNIAIMEEAKTRFNAINPDVEIEIIDYAKADVEQKLNIGLASNEADTLPDIVLIEDYNAQKYLQAFPGSFADLTDSFNYDEFAPYKVKLMTLDSKVYGVPFDSGVAGTYYRKDILEQAGFTAADLENITWDEFIEIGETVKDKTGVYMCAFDPTDNGLVRIMLQSAGSWYYDDAGKPFLAGNDVMKASLETYAKIINSPMTKQTSGWSEWVGAINSGDTASISTGVWITGSVKAGEDQAGNWALAPIPRLDVPGSVNASNLGGSSWYVLDTSDAKAEAIDFLSKTFASDLDFYQKILVDRGAVGSYIPSQDGEAYMMADDFFGGQKVFSQFSGYMQEIPSVDFGAYTYEADDAIIGILAAIYAGGDIDALLVDAQAQLESVIQQ